MTHKRIENRNILIHGKSTEQNKIRASVYPTNKVVYIIKGNKATTYHQTTVILSIPILKSIKDICFSFDHIWA